jgi:uncharacterized membrane protein YtjA (UPF0391 family)
MTNEKEGTTMLSWSIMFFVVALVAGALGFSGVAGAAAGIAKLLFGIFLLGFVVTLALGIAAANKISRKL